jgi:hypothetical protein
LSCCWLLSSRLRFLKKRISKRCTHTHPYMIPQRCEATAAVYL